MKRKSIVSGFLLLCAAFLLTPALTPAQEITSPEIDSLVALTMKSFEVPGIAVAVVKDDKIIHCKGYGVSSLNTRQKTDENTLFAIASNSKAFTGTALGMLVDEKKLNWNDKVIDYIPEFRLYDPWVTREFTIIDLLTHRSGLGLGAGDLMIWPGLNDFTLEDIIHNMRYLKPVSSFRTKYDYDNLMYILAGEVVARVSGMSWEDFIEKRIMEPLGMKRSAAAFGRLTECANIIDPHAPVNGKVQVIDRLFNFKEVGNAAGGIYSSVSDMSHWVMMQMNRGKYGDNKEKQLISENVHRALWTPYTMMPVYNPTEYRTHFSGYGLGWALRDVKGYLQVSHTGGLAGIVTQVTLLPELKLGIIVFTNQQSGAAFNAITNTIKDSYLGITGMDRVKQYLEAEQKNLASAQKITEEIWKDIEQQQAQAKAKPEIKPFIGVYADTWFGEITISEKGGKIRFDSKRSPKLTGEMFFYKGNTYVVKWDDRSMDADAFCLFSLDEKGNPVGMKMKAISPMTDFSYDFQDLEFVRK